MIISFYSTKGNLALDNMLNNIGELGQKMNK